MILYFVNVIRYFVFFLEVIMILYFVYVIQYFL